MRPPTPLQRIAAVAVLAFRLSPGPAAAADAGPPPHAGDKAAAVASSPSSTAAAQAECLALAARARELALREDYTGAADLYRKALTAFHNADVLFNLAASEQKAGRPVEALEHFRAYASDPDADHDRLAIVRLKLVPKALSETGHLNLERSPLAATYIDGTLLASGYWVPRVGVDTRSDAERTEAGENIFMVDVMPGGHEIVAISKGRKRRWHASVHVNAAETVVPTFEASDFPPSSEAAKR